MIFGLRYTISLIETQIVKIEVHEDAEIDLCEAIDMRKKAVQLVGDKKFAILFDANHRGHITPEARELFASKEYTDVRIAAAIVTNSLANKIIGNFFIKFNKPVTPTRIFSDQDSAVVWLREQLQRPV